MGTGRKALERQSTEVDSCALDYHRSLTCLTVSRLKIAALLVIAVVVINGAVQSIFDPDLFDGLLSTRLLAITLLLACWAACFHPRAGDACFAIGLVIVCTISADLETAIVFTSGYNSPFQTGLALLIVGSGLLVPFSPRQILIICALVWAVFLAPVFFAGQHISAHEPGFTASALFMACASIITMASSVMTSRLRRSEFFAQQALMQEKSRSEQLLLNILPQQIAARLQAGESSISDSLDEVSVLFADLVDFTELSREISADELVGMLNSLFSSFDGLVDKHGLEKVKTIGDAYMVVGGAPNAVPDHAWRMAGMALDMMHQLQNFNARNGRSLSLRIGIHCGPAIAGVIGLKKFTYDLWGDTVNIASRMESHGLPSRIQVSEDFYRVTSQAFEYEARGSIKIKGRGSLQTWWLKGVAASAQARDGDDWQ